MGFSTVVGKPGCGLADMWASWGVGSRCTAAAQVEVMWGRDARKRRPCDCRNFATGTLSLWPCHQCGTEDIQVAVPALYALHACCVLPIPSLPPNSHIPLAQGVELKLLALDRLLEQHPEWRGQLVLVQVGHGLGVQVRMAGARAFEGVRLDMGGAHAA